MMRRSQSVCCAIAVVLSGQVLHLRALEVRAPAPSAPTANTSSVAESSRRQPYVPGQLMVAFRSDATAFQRSQLHSLNVVTVISHNKSLNIDLVQTTRGEDVGLLAERYKNDPLVRYAEPNYYVGLAAETLPNDSFFNTQQWALRNTGQTGGTVDADVDAGEAWDTRRDCSSLIVAVMDTGVKYNHTDLSANIWANNDDCVGGDDDDGNDYDDDCRGWNFTAANNDPMDLQGHGTHVAGIIGAKGNNAKGVSGVCWDVKIMPLKVFEAGPSQSNWLVDAITYAVDNQAKVINFSASDTGNVNVVNDAIRYAAENDVLFVCAAGAPGSGIGVDVDVTHWYPCYADHLVNYRDLTNIVCVSSTDANDVREPNANFGAVSVDLFAPGVSIRSTGLSGANECGTSPITDTDGSVYTLCTGTSMATPHVAGAAALLAAQRGPGATHSNLKWSIMSSVDPKPSLNGLAVTGGRLNLAGALAKIADINPPTAPGNYSATATTTTSAFSQWTASADDVGVHHYELWRKDQTPAGPSKLIATLNPLTLTYTDGGLTANRAYLYTVFAVDSAGNRTGSADIASTRLLAVVSVGAVVTTAELTNLRLAINSVRALAGLSTVTFVDQPLTVGTQIKAIHVSQPRTVLDQARLALELSTGGYTDATLTGIVVKAQHLNELRSRLQ